MSSLVVYGHPISACTHRVQLMLKLLGQSFEERRVDLSVGAQKKEEFLRINPLGYVPVLVDGELTLRDSHAILIYLASRYDPTREWWPATQPDQALVAQWLFFQADDVHNGIGGARNHYTFGVPLDGAAARLRGERALEVLEAHLVSRDWLELGRPTLADVACYPLVSVAQEAGITLAERPAIRGWIHRLSLLPGFQPMPTLTQLRAARS
ncbi:MAG TPA: glutathione S-transferase family protein [Myxococcaceae bacterium]|nr:glutathione S-transferase family protein [Myxococcaceae bacterium]